MCKDFARTGEQSDSSVVLTFLSTTFALVKWENNPFPPVIWDTTRRPDALENLCKSVPARKLSMPGRRISVVRQRCHKSLEPCHFSVYPKLWRLGLCRRLTVDANVRDRRIGSLNKVIQRICDRSAKQIRVIFSSKTGWPKLAQIDKS